MIKKYLLLFLISTVIISCAKTRKSTNILYFTPDTSAIVPDQMVQAAAKNGWEIILTHNESFFKEDSLNKISAIFLPFSSVNALSYEAIPQLKRFLEGGGGGVVTLADSSLKQNGWPWLQEWSEKTDGSSWTQNLGQVYKLGKTYSDEEIEKAFLAAIAKNTVPDYAKATTLNVPDSSRYSRTVLAEGLDEPMEMSILPNNDVLFVERKGGVKMYDNQTKQIKTIANFDVFTGIEDGLLGMTTDPNFKDNNWIYFYYSVKEKSVNRLSRFELIGDSLAQSTEKVLLEIPTQRIYCCHSAGYLAFDKEGYLYLSTGDNTNAEETETYVPVDERPGRKEADDQYTAANTNDLRGKILRIKPLPDGTYAIPEGNLFPEGNPKARPEIYTMGSRNAYRFSIDNQTGYVYFGDVGPDTKVMGDDGEIMSFDEINQVRKAGFFGWPYFLGNNQAFPHYNFATKKEGPKKDPAKPINASPHNTGEQVLPPAQPAMIWYNKSTSKHFPMMKNGGASAMAGPVYHANNFPNAPYKLSPYYDGKLFIYEWIRGFLIAVTMDENGNYLRMEPFLPHMKFAAPIDMQFGSDGAIYMLEYGSNWFSKNTDARLIRIEYMEGNRNPIADITLDKQYGGAPFNVEFSGKNSIDHDAKDQLKFSWTIENKQIEGETIKHTFTKNGIHEVILTVTDDKGGKGTSTTRVYVGNTPPEVKINTTANRSFYWDNTALDYEVLVTDNEETNIDSEKIKVSFGYIPQGKDVAVILTNNQDAGSYKYLKGQQMIATLDCKSCHALDQASVGPTYKEIALKYNGKPNEVSKLADKIIQGGSGVWGERAMTPHPALSKADATELVNYILSVTDKGAKTPVKDQITLKEHIGKGLEGSYLLNASYIDQGANGIDPLPGRSHITLRNPFVQAEDFDEGNVRVATVTSIELYAYVSGINHNSYMMFRQIDLSKIKQLKYRIQAQSGGKIQIHLGKADGPVISTLNVPASSGTAKWVEMPAPVEATAGIHDLYFVFTDPAGNKSNLFNIDWVYFSN
jgi:cytochrome c